MNYLWTNRELVLDMGISSNIFIFHFLAYYASNLRELHNIAFWNFVRNKTINIFLKENVKGGKEYAKNEK